MSESANKVALVTGGARRIGAAIVRELHQQNYHVVIHYRNSEAEAYALSEMLNQQRPHSTFCIQADLCHIKNFPLMMDHIERQFSRLDVLINNASDFFPTEVGSTTEAEWNQLLDSNLKAPFFLAQAAKSLLRASQGHIINLADIHGQCPLRHYPVYSISKAGLLMLTQALAKELGPEIRVNAIAPGLMLWPEHENELDAAARADILSRISLKCAGEPQDIAQAVTFLLSSRYVTGHTLAVDGGRLLQM